MTKNKSIFAFISAFNFFLNLSFATLPYSTVYMKHRNLNLKIVYIFSCSLSFASRRKVKINVERGRCREFFWKEMSGKSFEYTMPPTAMIIRLIHATTNIRDNKTTFVHSIIWPLRFNICTFVRIWTQEVFAFNTSC